MVVVVVEVELVTVLVLLVVDEDVEGLMPLQLDAQSSSFSELWC